MKYKIQDTVDALGKPISLWHTDILGQEKAVCLMYLRGLTFMLEKGWTNAPLEMASNSHKAIWIENESGVHMGCVVYEYQAHNKQGWINLIFTEEKFRGRHNIYGILQKALEKEIIKLGGTSIASMTHKDNKSRLRAGAREGMEPQLIRLYKDLTPDLEKVKKELSDESRKPWSAISKERWNG
jgi:hypothetical protein